MKSINKNRRSILILTALWLLTAAGCSSQIGRDFSFEKSPGKAIVIASLPASHVMRSLCLQKYDPATNLRAKAFTSAGCFSTYEPFSNTDHEYQAIALEPGDYFVSQASVSIGSGKTVRGLSRDVLTFRVSENQIVYLGDFEVTDFASVNYLGFDEGRANEYLQSFPNLPEGLAKAEIIHKDVMPQ